MARTPELSRPAVLKWFLSQSTDHKLEVLNELKAEAIREHEDILAKLKSGMGSGSHPAVAAATLNPAHAQPAPDRKVVRSKKSALKGVKVPPKYRHPKTGETWAGRGVEPSWMREAIAKGAKREQFLIAKPKKK